MNERNNFLRLSRTYMAGIYRLRKASWWRHNFIHNFSNLLLLRWWNYASSHWLHVFFLVVVYFEYLIKLSEWCIRICRDGFLFLLLLSFSAEIAEVIKALIRPLICNGLLAVFKIEALILKPSYEFHFEGLSNFSHPVEGLVQIQDVHPWI